MTVTAPAPNPRRAKTQRPQPKQGQIPRRQQNGYYADHVTGDRLRSVTTIMEGGVPKDSLVHWYASTAADAAIEIIPSLAAASRSPERLTELRTHIRNAPTRRKEERGDIGSVVHKMIECHILGLPVPDEIEVGDGDKRHAVRLDDPEVAPILPHFHRFVAEWDVTFTASEMVVANPTCGYAGTLDYLFKSRKIALWLHEKGYRLSDDDHPAFDPAQIEFMGDTKTGGTFDRLTTAGHVHGVYPEAGMQMSAYRHAEVCWLKSGDRVPMPTTAPVGVVLHLRPEGYRAYPARADDQVFAYFRHAQMVDEWTSKIASAKAESPIIGPPMEQERITNDA